jgi:hypothetical protein
VKWVAAATLCLFAIPASAITIGDKACANAEVVADVGDQTWEHLVVPNSDAVITDVILHVKLHVKRVIYGSAPTGPLEVIGVAPNELNPLRNARFFLRGKHDTWNIASCRPTRDK